MFDSATRNRLAAFVSSARRALCGDYNKPGGEITSLLQTYGIQPDGTVADLDTLPDLDQRGYELASTLRDVLAHKRANTVGLKAWGKYDPHVYDLIQEQAFTVLNRLCALRMAEERGILPYPVVSKGHNSDGFDLYEMVADKKRLSRDERYETFLFSVFDELSLDLGVLFDRFSPHGMLFPRPDALGDLLEEINDPALAPLWAEDETIGWIYQYWNSKEERKAMRDASAAPRNSRELAVRNQFFTPRYVVEFLTDNTLGRIWYEMTKGQTRLADQCRYLVRRPTEIFLNEGEEPPAENEEQSTTHQELLREPVHIPHRPVKDPREIRLLDPACGSMHFGLYAFDLFEVIYEESWDNGLCPALQEVYGKKEDYLRDVPRLIIEHNIHGVDIDPRAVQIAGLSLWLRAQKTWRDTPAAARPRVRRSNIVCAEPMPGSDAMLQDFVQTLDPPLLGELVKTVFDKMQLAGEAGTLLKIEDEIRTAIDDAKSKWEKLGASERDLFSAAALNETLRPGTQQELTGIEKALITDQRSLGSDFFDTAEERIYAALRDYAESAEAGDYQRRLFAEDAAHGFAFIDLCRKRYDAVVMNPPFGAAPLGGRMTIESAYPKGKSDLFAAFFIRACELLNEGGLVGQISSRVGMFLPTLLKWRDSVFLGERRLAVIADLGHGVLDDALVEAAAYTCTKRFTMPSLFSAYDCLGASAKGEALLDQVQDSKRVSLVSHSSLKSLPGHPIAYWLDPAFIKSVFIHEPLTESVARPRVGLQTDDDFRFLRLSWETPHAEGSWLWRPLAKGGEYSPFYDNMHLSVNWSADAREMRAFIEQRYSWTKNARSVTEYGKPGLTYPSRTTSEFSPRPLPKGTVFSVKGQAILPVKLEDGFGLLAITCSRLFRVILETFVGAGDAVNSGSAARDYKAGTLAKVPMPRFDCDHGKQLNRIGADLVRLAMAPFADNETSRIFAITDIETTTSLTQIVKHAQEQEDERCAALEEATKQAELIAIQLYGLSVPDTLAYLTKEYGPHPSQLSGEANDESVRRWFGESVEHLVDHLAESRGFTRQTTKRAYWTDRRYESAALLLDTSVTAISKARARTGVLPPGALTSFTEELLSYLIGLALGRWDIRYATGERQPPELPDPFDPLPVCPPGMLQNADGLPMEKAEGERLKAEGNYPLRISWPGILVDDEGHPEDIVARVRDALAVIWGDRSAAIEQEACEILGVRSLRDYFAEKKSGGKFFKDHLKRYSKSRRQAPIYWSLSTESGTYTLWIYYHRLTEDTLYACITNFVAPKQEQSEKTLARLAAKGDARTQADDKEYEQTESLIGELATFRAELERLAKIWKSNLNDGVQITAAPLWNLFRLKPWQTKLKTTWNSLEKGDYDWAHLARTLWPERVIPKCATDRSLAIAHGYEEDLWEEVENDRGKLIWQQKANAEEIVEQLINTN